MISRISKKFRAYYRDLPSDIKVKAKKGYEQFKLNPYHPGLNFEKIQNSNLVSVRVGID